MNEVIITANKHNQIEVYAVNGEAIVSEILTFHASKLEAARKAAAALNGRINEDTEALATLTAY